MILAKGERVLDPFHVGKSFFYQIGSLFGAFVHCMSWYRNRNGDGRKYIINQLLCVEPSSLLFVEHVAHVKEWNQFGTRFNQWDELTLRRS